ncbi:hypothetical protein JW824_02815 [bacterium]|nr:hypothetical protein [bacterium]
MKNLKTFFTEDRTKTISIILISLYLIVLSVFAICSLVGILDTDSHNITADIRVCFFELTVSKEMQLILIAAVMGLLGSLIYCITSFTSYIGNNRFVPRWTLWYLLRPIIGIPLAIILYLALRGGVLTWGSDAESINQYGIAAICGLVGMFSRQTIDKLREVFENLFSLHNENERADKLKNGK